MISLIALFTNFYIQVKLTLPWYPTLSLSLSKQGCVEPLRELALCSEGAFVGMEGPPALLQILDVGILGLSGEMPCVAGCLIPSLWPSAEK